MDFGAALKAIHTTKVPAGLAGLIPCETYSPRWRKMVKTFQAQIEMSTFDNPSFAPKERDLILVGGSTVWNNPSNEALFYQGYGPAEIDRMALAYYRYERIIQDIAAITEQK